MPTVVLRVGHENPTIEIKGQLDSCSQTNLLPLKWVPLLEAEGCKFNEVPPEAVGWLDGRPQINLTQAVDIVLKVVGCNEETTTIKVFVCPADFDELLIGWNTMVRCK